VTIKERLQGTQIKPYVHDVYMEQVGNKAIISQSRRVDMSNLDEFKKWLSKKDWRMFLPEVYADHSYKYKGWSAACELKDNEIAALRAELTAEHIQNIELRCDAGAWKNSNTLLKEQFHKQRKIMEDALDELEELKSLPFIESTRQAIGIVPVPEGYVPVPIYPTDKMIDLACDITDTFRVEMVRAYEAMISEAQKEV
jgi:hypothetical protein